MLDAVRPPATTVVTGPEGAEPAFTVCYNGSCPICSREIAVYRRKAEAPRRAGALDRRVGAAVALPRGAEGMRHAAGVDREGLLKRMHAVGRDGRPVAGIDAFLVVWRALPGYEWLARLAALPGIRPGARLALRQRGCRGDLPLAQAAERKGLVPGGS